MASARRTDGPGPADRDSDVLIVGAGVVGLAAAIDLAGRGLSVTVVDRATTGSGASFGNAGWLTPSLASPLAQPGSTRKALKWMLDPESPFYIKPSLDPALLRWLLVFLRSSSRERYERGVRAMVELCLWSVDAWEREASESGESFGFERAGLLMLLESEKSADGARAHAAFTEGSGVAWEWWDQARVRAEEPIIRGETVGGIFFPGDAHCEPHLAVRRLRARAESLGVRVVEHSEVTGFDTRGGSLEAARVGESRICAKEFVIASGAWAGRLGATLGLRIPMRAAKGYSVVLPKGAIHPRRSIYLADRKVAVTPHAQGLRLAGTLELVGLDASINRRRVDAIVRGAGAMLSVVDPIPELRPWAGLRPCLADGMPAIGRAPGFGNLWLAIGHQMTGLKCAPGTAQLLGDLMTGASPAFDPGLFDPARCCRPARV
ncbi:MAG: FAD-dependent oxidoreductase [Phycisphaeraceae bacterium]|nr:FAD-dependent oxidoreductase [Phycisphaeraceae bacterium]